mmetsp:Transcript_7797/g.11518  ORF Transcript_7797/g.11518 Transcript_7797/m.11518 type:complete len:605 (+) Transcript_7797:150-1964(+)
MNKLLISGLLTTFALVSAERKPAELQWSSQKCRDLGHGNDRFDECAEIEFCETEGNGGYRRRLHQNRHLLRGKRSLHMMEEEEENVPEVVYDGVEMWAQPKESSTEEYGDPNTYEMMEEEDEVVYDSFGLYDEGGNFVAESMEYDESEEYYESFEGGGGGGRYATFGWRIPGGECTWPGPTMRMSRGKTYGLFVRGSGNEDTVTNIHTHGLHIPGHGNADDVTRTVSGSDVIIYEYHIPTYHMGGTHWYHAHWHHHSEQFVGGGAFGMLIVEDGSNVGTGVDAGVEAFLKNEKIFIASNHEDIYGPFIVNGVEGDLESYDFNSDEWYRLRILTVNLNPNTSSRTISFGDECQAYAIAHDGIFRFEVPARTAQNDFSIGDASRLDVAIRCALDSTISINDETVATIKAGQPSTKSVVPSPFKSSIEGQSWSSTRPDYLADLRDAITYDTYELKLDETNINQQTYSLEKPLCLGHSDVQYGSIYEWELRLSYHPLHLHIYPMQVVSENNECGENHEYGEFYDTITISNEGMGRSRCKVRIAFVDVGGKTLMQCHLFKHGDQGAMAFFHVVGGPTQPDEPRVHECASGLCDEPVSIPLCSSGESLNT